MATKITPSDEADISFYYGAQGMFARSTFGGMLQRAEMAAYDSEGNRTAMPHAGWHWLPGGEDAPMFVRKPGGDGEQGYEIDDRDLFRFARVSRRLLAIEQMDPPSKRVLEAYYGDRGARWAALAVDDVAGIKVVRKGSGPGAIASLYVLTKPGVELLAKERARSASRAKGMTAPDIGDDDVLKSVFDVQAAQPDAMRKMRLNKVRDHAEAFLLRAWGAWLSAPTFLRGKESARAVA